MLLLSAACGTTVFLGELPPRRCSTSVPCLEGQGCLGGVCLPRAGAGSDAGGDAGAPDGGPLDAGSSDGGADGPRIRLRPAPLAFGKVEFFAQASPPSYQSRKLTVANVGTPDAALKLGRGGARPYWAVRALNAGTSPSELTVAEPPRSGPGAYDPALGIAVGSSVDLLVKLSPASIGRKELELTVFSNDRLEPESRVVITADAVALPPCQLVASASSLSFGHIVPPDFKELALTLANAGTQPGELCLLSSIELLPGSHPLFSLPAGPVPSLELGPQETANLIVRAWPQGPTTAGIVLASGNLQVHLSAPAQPLRQFPLTASVGLGCLSIAPDEADFGTVQLGCTSAAKSFSVYNICAAEMTVTSIEVAAAAGQRAGGPACPGPAACPELLLASAPVPDGGFSLSPGGSPAAFSLRYRPIDLGADFGAVAVTALQGGQPVSYLATLQGRADTSGLNTDVFVQDAQPKADILLVIDNSCSMSEEQQSLAQNFASFIQHASSQAVDFRIAVTTTDDSSSGEQGRFVSGAAHPETVLTQTTADLEAKFRAKVSVGTSGAGPEQVLGPALRALSAPLVTTVNAGFLRQEAVLAVVGVTDEPDQSPLPYAYYLDGFRNLKGPTRPHLFTFNAIAGFFTAPPPGCAADPDDGRLAAVATLTAGVKESICTADWAKSLQTLGKTAFGFRTHFALNAVPDLAGGKSITVQIDGAAVPSVDSRGVTVWTYDPTSNAIDFEPGYTPGPGQRLEVSYFVGCW